MAYYEGPLQIEPWGLMNKDPFLLESKTEAMEIHRKWS
jgi:hypothetical protein